MSDLERPSQTITPPDGHDTVPGVIPMPGVELPPTEPPPRTRTKIKWLRLIALLTGLGTLAAISTVFGMMMAVASDLPQLDVFAIKGDKPTEVRSADNRLLGRLTGQERRILVRSDQISPVMKQAMVAIEDRRFYEHSGVDVRGIGRALWQDVVAKKAVQGGSTITQQLVKNRLEAQNQRTILQKLREAATAFHMTRKWDKQKILTNYLNTIYFGNGAYGVESAAKTYFGSQHVGCGDRGERTCAASLEPQEAALIAGVVASPSAYDPIAHPAAATARRNLVLLRMREQGYLSPLAMQRAVAEPVPGKVDIEPPREDTRFPYFTTWVRQQVVDRVGAGLAFEGGLTVRTTIDYQLQEAAQNAVRQFMGDNNAPAAAMVALDNHTSEVLAMVGGPLDGDGYNRRPFNLATQGQRQPGSSFKPFILAEALRQNISPASVWSSKKKFFCVTRRKGKCVEWFPVNNYENRYAGSQTLAQATAFSDNSVYAEVGLKIGTKKVARMARRMGIRTPVSTNPAITLGGLREGVTVLDMAHAYTTFANGGKLPYGSLSPGAGEEGATPGPVGIRRIVDSSGKPIEMLDGEDAVNKRESRTVFSKALADEATGILQGVVKYGTGKAASLGPDIPVAGKTGTTEDYGDAWFVGWTPRYTVAVWVGFPDEVKSMKPPVFSYQGKPVAGGTYPAAIWHAFMKMAEDIYAKRHPEKAKKIPDVLPGTTTAPAPATSAPAATATPAPANGGTGTGGGGGGQQAPAEKPQAQKAPQENPPPSDPGAPADPGTGAAPPGGAGGATPAPENGAAPPGAQTP